MYNRINRMLSRSIVSMSQTQCDRTEKFRIISVLLIELNYLIIRQSHAKSFSKLLYIFEYHPVITLLLYAATTQLANIFFGGCYNRIPIKYPESPSPVLTNGHVQNAYTVIRSTNRLHVCTNTHFAPGYYYSIVPPHRSLSTDLHESCQIRSGEICTNQHVCLCAFRVLELRPMVGVVVAPHISARRQLRAPKNGVLNNDGCTDCTESRSLAAVTSIRCICVRFV